MVDYFTPQNYVPVLVNRGYTVGDVVEVDGVNFYARALRCFPRLKPPDPVQTALTDVLENSSSNRRSASASAQSSLRPSCSPTHR